MSKVYVITAPEPIRGIYQDWPRCQAAVHGISGARFQTVSSLEEANAILDREGVTLPPGIYAFVDGNAQGGVGVVLVMKREVGQAVHEVSTTVRAVFGNAHPPVPTLDDPASIDRALEELRNILAELAAAYHAVRIAPRGTSLTLVYDYLGIGAWLQGQWGIRDRRVDAIIHATRAFANEKGIQLGFHHQPSHRSTHAGRHDYAAFNARADALAQAAGMEP